MRQEANSDQRAISPAGAIGLMQLMPDTARTIGVASYIWWRQNIEGWVWYLRQMLDPAGGDVPRGVTAYNLPASLEWPYEQRPEETRIYWPSIAE